MKNDARAVKMNAIHANNDKALLGPRSINILKLYYKEYIEIQGPENETIMADF